MPTLRTDSQTGKSVVVAARRLLATLDKTQRAGAVIALSPTSAARWSNLPASPRNRYGVQRRTVSETQLTAALGLGRVALGA